MLITTQGKIYNLDEATLLSVRVADTQYYIHGFFYLAGYSSGEESVRALQLQIEETDSIPFDQMYGAFSCLIIDSNGRKLFFPCNSELHCVYYSDYAVSDRFLELLMYHRENNLPLNYQMESVCEYYTLGNVFFENTLVQEIQILNNDCYFVWQDGERCICRKMIGGIDGTPRIRDAKTYWNELAIALSNQRVAISLTGGYDSSFVFVELYKSYRC